MFSYRIAYLHKEVITQPVNGTFMTIIFTFQSLKALYVRISIVKISALIWNCAAEWLNALTLN